MIFYTAADPWQPIQEDTNSAMEWLMRFDEEAFCCEVLWGKTISFLYFHSQASAQTFTTIDVTVCGSSCAASVVNGAGKETGVLS